jgi:hypothetical protein
MSHRVGSCLLQKEICIGLHMHIRKVDGALPLKISAGTGPTGQDSVSFFPHNLRVTMACSPEVLVDLLDGGGGGGTNWDGRTRQESAYGSALTRVCAAHVEMHRGYFTCMPLDLKRSWHLWTCAEAMICDLNVGLLRCCPTFRHNNGGIFDAWEAAAAE